jgi:hypothetical protein
MTSPDDTLELDGGLPAYDHISFLSILIDNHEAAIIPLTSEQACSPDAAMTAFQTWVVEHMQPDSEAHFQWASPDLMLSQFLTPAGTTILAFATAFAAPRH